jgi:hypothetical protein
MRKLIIPAAVVAALVLAPTPSQAQYVIQNGYAQPYYGGATIGNGGIIQAVEGQVLNSTGLGQYVYPYTSG